MKRCSLFCNGWWSLLWILFLSGLLLLLLLFFKWSAIEKDVAANTQNSLNSAGISWADAETYHRGREVLINGSAPDQASVDNALSIARDAEGVNSAKFVGEIKKVTLVPAALSIIAKDEKIILEGTVADQATVDALVARATQRYGADKIVNQLKVQESTQALPNVNGLFGMLDGLKTGSVMRVRNGEITLFGEVTSGKIKTNIGNNVAKVFSGPVNNQLTVIAPATVAAPVPAPKPEKQKACQDSVNQLLSNSKVNFQTGRAAIKEDSHPLLKSIAEIAGSCPNARFEVAGHTDSTGSLELNNQLSKQRAQAVVDHLIGLGLQAAQFTAAGYGPSQPIGDNNTSEGRAQNRRIEFKLIN